jgi:hypothetical protein
VGAIPPCACIFPVITRWRGELVVVTTPYACADLTAFGRMTTIDRNGRLSGGKRAMKTQSGGAGATRRSQRPWRPK